MTPEELDEARAREAEERWRDMHPNDRKHTPVGTIAARLAREGWTPPEPVVDPDILAFREWETRAGCSDKYRKEILEGKWDHSVNARAYLAGARMAREQERERAKVLVECVERYAGPHAAMAIANYRGEA